MAVNEEKYHQLLKEFDGKVTLVAVSKTKPAEEIRQLYNLGHRDFGENYVQELLEKQAQLPADIRWHFIGHLQSNKVKNILPFIHLIHGVDSIKLLNEINKQAGKLNTIAHVLLQVHIAREETKFGLDEKELHEVMEKIIKYDTDPASWTHIKIDGLMGMASFSDNKELVQSEFHQLKNLYDKYASINNPHCRFSVLSMGMSADYPIAIGEGSTLVRIGSLLFGERINH